MRGTLSTIFAALALGLPALPAGAEDMTALALAQVKADPAPFLALAGDLIRAEGGDMGVDRTGIDRFVALERAVALASARRLQRADTDRDGIVSLGEMAVLVTTSADGGARLWAQHSAADTDGDGVLTRAEVAAFGREEALKLFSSEQEALARSVLGFDANGDGFVSLDEVRAAVSAMGT